MRVEFMLIGFLVGGLVGMTGVGGASILTPFLMFFGIHPSIAVGTDFAYNTITKLFAAVQHVRQKTIDYKLVKCLALGSLPGAVAANFIFYYLFRGYNQNIIMLLLGYVLAIMSLIAIAQLIFANKITSPWKLKPLSEKRLITIFAGLIMGAVVGATSVGAGSLFTLFILFFYDLNSKEVVGTDILHAFILVTITGILMAGYGHIDYVLTVNLLIGSVPGTLIGSRLVNKIPSALIRPIIICIILFSGLKLIF